jgi:hypothetical protein
MYKVLKREIITVPDLPVADLVGGVQGPPFHPKLPSNICKTQDFRLKIPEFFAIFEE